MAQVMRVGTRGSALARRQTETIIAALQAAAPHLRFEPVPIVTHGDRFSTTPITAMGAEVERGIFNSALEAAVLAGEVDLATFSFKDVESQLPPGIVAESVCERGSPWDVLVSRHGVGVSALPHGAVLGTSSPRRTSQLAAYRPDLAFQPLRGNVNTRVERESARFDGVVLAAAGVERLGLTTHVTERIAADVLLPAPAQGALGCEYLQTREDVAALVRAIQHEPTERCVRVEKRVLVGLSGGCFAPVGVLAEPQADGRARVRCRVAALDGSRVVDEQVEGPLADPDALVAALVERVRAAGGLELVQAARRALQGGDAPTPA